MILIKVIFRYSDQKYKKKKSVEFLFDPLLPIEKLNDI